MERERDQQALMMEAAAVAVVENNRIEDGTTTFAMVTCQYPLKMYFLTVQISWKMDTNKDS